MELLHSIGTSTKLMSFSFVIQFDYLTMTGAMTTCIKTLQCASLLQMDFLWCLSLWTSRVRRLHLCSHRNFSKCPCRKKRIRNHFAVWFELISINVCIGVAVITALDLQMKSRKACGLNCGKNPNTGPVYELNKRIHFWTTSYIRDSSFCFVLLFWNQN